MEELHINKIVEEMSTKYAGLIKPKKIKNHTVFSAKLDKQYEDDEVLEGIEIYVNLKSNQKLKESHFDEIDVRSQLEQQTQNQQSKDSGWRFDKTNSMTLHYNKNTESNGSSYENFH